SVCLTYSINITTLLSHLTSFPTRRSSDLGHGDTLFLVRRDRRKIRMGRRFHAVAVILHRRLVMPGVAHFRNVLGSLQGRLHCLRSEEHTSELQSRSDLVCRLLLEKKKKIT